MQEEPPRGEGEQQQEEDGEQKESHKCPLPLHRERKHTNHKTDSSQAFRLIP